MTQPAIPIDSSTSPSAGEVFVEVVPPGAFDDETCLEFVRHIQPAIDRSGGRVGMQEVLKGIDDHMFQCWISRDGKQIVGAAVTHVVRWGTGRKTLRLILAGGKWNMHRNTVPTMKAIEEFAVKAGCQSVTVEGRKGWGRALPDGYKFAYAAFEKEV